MSKGKNRKEIWPWESIRALNKMFETIPSAEERQKLLESIDDLINFLRELRIRILNLPKDEERMPLMKATTIVSNFLERAHADPTLASMIGLSLGKDIARKKVGKQKVYLSEGELTSIVKEFESLPTEKMYERLESYAKNQLFGIAKHVGIHVNSRLSKADLIDKIVKIGFANIRGYRLLRSPNINNRRS